MKRLFVFIWLLASIQSAYGQRHEHETMDIEQVIGEIFAIQDEDINYTEMYEALLSSYANPLDLNTATLEELRSLYILSEKQILEFEDYRTRYGPLLSIYELQAIPSFNVSTAKRLLHFTHIVSSGLTKGAHPFLQRVLKEENNYLLLRYERTLEEKRGFSPIDSSSTTRYKGSPDQWYARFRVSHTNDFSLGLTTEKDAGEQLILDPKTKRYGNDFYSFHLQLKNRGKLKNVILGDFQLQSGQGLIFGSGFNIGKGAETITTTRRVNSGIRPYTALQESHFFRGAAITAKVSNNVTMTTLYSRINQDAVIQTDEVSAEFVSTIRTSGFHRTTSEISAKDQLMEQNAGVSVTYQKNRLMLGANYLFTRYSIPMIRNTTLISQNEFAGKDNMVYGTFFNYAVDNYTFFGEIARSASGGHGIVTGLLAPLSKKVESALLFRNYSKAFHSFYGNGFGELNRNNNERGWYWGIKYTHDEHISLSAYFDSFTFDWIRSSALAPSQGHEYLLRLNYSIRKHTRFYFQYRRQSKARNATNEDLTGNIPVTVQGVKDNYLVNLEHKVSNHFSFKSRIQWSSFTLSNPSTQGFVLIQDVNANVKNWRISGRMALFETDDFDNRQYAFERDVLYLFSIPALNGKGIRNYFMLQYKLSRNVDFWLKYSRTHFRNAKTIGSGLEEINGSKRTVIRLQTRLRF
ncbi:helix-hairpin-helix domain-containing protein [Fulvivirga sp. M361]|uniref:ComEA family DNA-binding protein n=1 Tax=Fulvivirga sp. M361 TaxID=2594266 RepID=UPI00117AB9B4|nr:helix-hairpin-helix domain-containing protein [Fulvivirga sp. M361]TRX62198.1 helix-hairpin-helix domain-containing protein [Fulvivirga sp. M361]